jgi:ABC-type transporter Mla subunit MlaD
MGLELLLPVLFFLITLVIIYLIRLDDKRNRRLDLIKKRMDDFSAEVERVIQNFRESAQLTEERINKRTETSKTLSIALDAQLADLQNRSDDLAKLQDVLNTYRDSISRLGATTASVEGRIGQVKRETERLEAVNEKIRQFDARLAQHTEEFERSMEEEQARYENFESRLDNRYDEYEHKSKELQSQGEGILQTTASAFDELVERLRSQQRAQEQTIATTTAQFEELLAQHRENLDALIKQTNETFSSHLQAFATSCDSELQTMVDRSVERTDETFKGMVGVIIGFIQDLEDRATQSEELNALLIRQQEANLAEYSEEIQLMQKLSRDSEESIRRDELRRRELLEVRTHLREETAALRKDLDQMIEEKKALLASNTQSKAEQESLQSSLAALSLQLIERQDELISAFKEEEPSSREEEPIEELLDDDEDEDDSPLEEEEEETDTPVEEESIEGFLDDDEDEDDSPLEEEEAEADEEADTPVEEESLEGFLDDDEDEDDSPLEEEEEDTDDEADTPVEESIEELLDDDEDELPLEETEIVDTPTRAPEEELALLEEGADHLDEIERREEQEWIEYIPDGEEEEISLDEEDEFGS